MVTGHVVGVVTGAVRVEHRVVSCARWRLPSSVIAAVAGIGLLVAFVDTGLSPLAWAFLVTGCLAAITAMVSAALGPDGKRCEVRRFGLTGERGEHVDCVAVGALHGIELRAGDHVTVRGKPGRQGILSVRRILVTVTAAGATPRPGIGFLTARAANAVAAVLVVVLVVLTGFLILGIG